MSPSKICWRHYVTRWPTQLDISQEYDNIGSWSVRNKLKTINRPTGKTKEIVFRRSTSRHLTYASFARHWTSISGYITGNWHHTYTLSTSVYVNKMLTQINQRLYLLAQLKLQGLNIQALHTLFTGLIMSKIMYAWPAFAGQLTADDRCRMGAISRKALRRGVSHTDFDIDEIINSADRKLFSQITQTRHCLHHLLPPKTFTHYPYSLRKRQHYYQLPHVEYSQYTIR